MLGITRSVRKNISAVITILTVIFVSMPFLIIYLLYPSYQQYPNSFEITWKGRTFYLFFLWLFFLEVTLGWEELRTVKYKLKSIRTVVFIIALLLPSIYVIAANNYGLNKMIVDLTYRKEVPSQSVDWMPLSTEYLVFTVLFALIVLLAYHINGLTNFSISIVFLGVIGFLYTIDNLYPEGRFTPFQFLVPTTATLAANVLNLIGYKTLFLAPDRGMPHLQVFNSTGAGWHASIAWVCSGIDSLIIYSVTILLFLKKTTIPWTQRIVYFLIGALVTYFINILRIVTIFEIGVNSGGNQDAVNAFHSLYGQLYSVIWIISYPLIIIGSRALWGKIRDWRASATDTSKLSPQIKPF
jgi:thaumarchaeosortase